MLDFFIRGCFRTEAATWPIFEDFQKNLGINDKNDKIHKKIDFKPTSEYVLVGLFFD